MYKLQSMIHSLHELICPDSRFRGDKDFQASFWSGSRAVYITACSSARDEAQLQTGLGCSWRLQ